MTPGLQAVVIANLRDHEGVEPYMYRDTNDVVTVGVGHALFTPRQAYELPFVNCINKAPARNWQIDRVFVSLKEDGQMRDRSLMLEDDDINQLLLADLAHFDRALHIEFPAFDLFPITAQIALFDMIFNLGSFGAFPQFVIAIRARDWRGAAMQCKRKGIGLRRNQDTQRQFEIAAATA